MPQSMFLWALRIFSLDFIDQVINLLHSIAKDGADVKYSEHLIFDGAYHRAIKLHDNSNGSIDPFQIVPPLPFYRPFLLLVNTYF